MLVNFKVFAPIFLFFSITVYSTVASDRFKLLDFEVYYKAGQRIAQDINPYQQVIDGHFIYKYSPVFAAIMSPFGFLKLDVAKWFFLIIIFIIFYLTLITLINSFKLKSQAGMITIASVLIFSKHIHKELVLGQINVLILGLFVFSVYLFYSKKFYSAMLLALSIFIKPIGLVLFPYLIFKRNIAWFYYFVLSIILLFLMSLFFVKIDLYFNWFIELQNELLLKSDLYSVDSQNLIAFIQRVLHIDKPLNYLFGLFIWLVLQYYLQKNEPEKYPYLLISSLPLLVCTSNNFYILSLPVFIYLIGQFKNMTITLKLLFILSGLLMSFNQYELWGRKGVDTIDYFTPYGLSVLIGYFVLIRNRINYKFSIIPV